MRKLTLTQFVTLDGVAQSPGASDEDPSGGFKTGGWLTPFAGDGMFEVMLNRIGQAGGFVFGRVTYEIFAGHWPHMGDDDPIASQLNNLPKYVASTTLQRADWDGTNILRNDVADAIRKLKGEDGSDLQVHGSGQLAQTLIREDLIDLYELLVFPVVLGAGKRLFETKLDRSLRLTGSTVTETGINILTYEPDGPLTFESIDDPRNR